MCAQTKDLLSQPRRLGNVLLIQGDCSKINAGSENRTSAPEQALDHKSKSLPLGYHACILKYLLSGFFFYYTIEISFTWAALSINLLILAIESGLELNFLSSCWPSLTDIPSPDNIKIKLTIIFMKETREIIILYNYTENATLKQTLHGACPTAQRLASSVLELTETIQSHPFLRKSTSWVYKPQTGQKSGRALQEYVIHHIYLLLFF